MTRPAVLRHLVQTARLDRRSPFRLRPNDARAVLAYITHLEANQRPALEDVDREAPPVVLTPLDGGERKNPIGVVPSFPE